MNNLIPRTKIEKRTRWICRDCQDACKKCFCVIDIINDESPPISCLYLFNDEPVNWEKFQEWPE